VELLLRCIRVDPPLRCDKGLERLRAWRPTCRESLRAGANNAAVTVDGSDPTVNVNRRRHGAPGVILTGRATSMPFTEVLAGPERATTDNTTAVVTCAAHLLPRQKSCRIWLWEQGVAGAFTSRRWGSGPNLPRRRSGEGCFGTLSVLWEAAVGCRGVLFAIDQEELQALRQATSDSEVQAVVAAIEERWDERFLAETDKAWDAIHRCLTDGTLAWVTARFRSTAASSGVRTSTRARTTSSPSLRHTRFPPWRPHCSKSPKRICARPMTGSIRPTMGRSGPRRTSSTPGAGSSRFVTCGRGLRQQAGLSSSPSISSAGPGLPGVLANQPGEAVATGGTGGRRCSRDSTQGPGTDRYRVGRRGGIRPA
jgi:hypothetical protein